MLNIYNAGAELPDVLPRNSIVHRPYQNASAHIASESVDLVLIDPPYTDGVTDALPNHKIQTKFDINHVMSESYRILKPDGFFVFFGQMPTVLAWLNSATAVFRYKEHITWCKRNITSPYLPIQRSKEEIFVYAKGKPKYYETQEKYEDLKTPALHLGIYELSTIKTTISDLQRRCIDNAYNMKYFSGVPTSRGDHNDETLRYTSADRPKQDGDKAKCENDDLARFELETKNQKLQIAHGRANDEWLEKKMLNAALEREQKAKQDFEEMQSKGQECAYKGDKANDALFARCKNENKSHRYRSKHWCNLTNVWAFMPAKDRPVSYSQMRKRTKQTEPIWSYLPQNQTKMGKDGENWKHPTVKPVKLYERLLKLLTPAPTQDYTPLCVDFFVGSGTLAAAAANCGVDFIVSELQEDYFNMTVVRTEKAIKDKIITSPKLPF